MASNSDSTADIHEPHTSRHETIAVDGSPSFRASKKPSIAAANKTIAATKKNATPETHSD